MKVINREGTEINFEAAIMYMDDEVMENIHDALAPCTEQEFFTSYEKAHEEAFDEVWELSKVNPIW